MDPPMEYPNQSDYEAEEAQPARRASDCYPSVGDYRILHHDANWDGSKSTHDYWRIECLEWMKRAGEFTSRGKAEQYAQQVSVMAKSYETSRRVLVRQRTVLIEALETLRAEMDCGCTSGSFICNCAKCRIKSDVIDPALNEVCMMSDSSEAR